MKTWNILKITFHSFQMKLLPFYLIIFCLFTSCYGAGSITHMFIAEETAMTLPDKQLKNLILNNMDAYLVGSNFPDTGYIQGTSYGLDSHLEIFINTFITYLHEQYSFPEQQNPKLVAFLLGCATHQTVDQLFHGVFINKISAEDFKGDWQKAHRASERNLDFLINIDKNQWLVRPHIWWIPLHDLLAVYRKMGKKQYSMQEVLWGNAVYSLNGINERVLSIAGYFYAQRETPWLAKHYYDSPQGLLFAEQLSSNYLLEVWHHILNWKQNTQPMPAKNMSRRPISNTESISPTFTFA